MKLNESSPNRNFIKLALMIVLTAGVQILTLMKSTIVASSFGTSEDMDAYNFANSIVSFVFGVVISGISTIIIPEYANKRERRVVDTFITVMYGGTLIATAILIICRYPIIYLFSNRGEAFAAVAANVIVVLLLSQFLAAFSGITAAFFQCENKHNTPKVVSLLCQGIVIIVLMCLNGKMHILEYALIVAGGSILGFVIDTIIALKSGWRFTPTVQLDAAGKTILSRFLPIIFSGGVYRLSLLIDSMIATLLSTGMITILGYSTQISSMVSTIVVGNLLLYIYPKITRNVQNDGHQNQFWAQSRGLHAIVCLMIAGFVCVGKEAVLMLLNRGKFSAEACETVFYAAAIYIFGQGTSIIRDMVYRYFYALGNTKIPAQNSILVSVCNIVLSLILVKLMGFYGIVTGTVVASLISLCIIMFRFHKSVGFSKKISHIVASFFGNYIVAAITVILVYATKLLMSIENNLLAILVFGVESVVIYVVTQFLFNRNVIKTLRTL